MNASSDPLPFLPSPNHDERPAGAQIDLVVLHYTGMQTAAGALARLRDPAPPSGIPVSSHYVVDENGAIVQLVADHHRAWHAGISYWRGRERLNDVSIGIEIVNPGHEWGYRPFPATQIAAVRRLCDQLKRRHGLSAAAFVGHSDIAPDRKRDPGELFPWSALGADHDRAWPPPYDTTPITAHELAGKLRQIGYRADTDADIAAAIWAFQRRWRQHLVDGMSDAETIGRLRVLALELASDQPG